MHNYMCIQTVLLLLIKLEHRVQFLSAEGYRDIICMYVNMYTCKAVRYIFTYIHMNWCGAHLHVHTKSAHASNVVAAQRDIHK